MLLHPIGGDVHHLCHFLVSMSIHVALLQYELGLGRHGVDDGAYLGQSIIMFCQ